MDPCRILVADDEREILVSCRKILERAGYDVTTVPDGSAALECLKAGRYDLLLVDLKMPGPSGMDVLSLARDLDPALTMVMFTAYATVATAVDAVKRGAFDYLAKPFTADQLQVAVARALDHRRLVAENTNLREQLVTDLGFEKILGTSAAMRKVFATLRKVVRSDANILLQGETGTGKELVARTIHAQSLRSSAPFVAVDCAALPDHLLESELFGHEKGAFTSADRAKAGLIELAHRGTLFLDEIGELSPALQVKFLRTLQEREFRRVGGDRPIPVDIRVIAATNRDVRAEIGRKNFREELYYRLNVITVVLPPLRERQGDVGLLARHLLDDLRRRCERPVRAFAPDVMKAFDAYHWPGNIRELQNVVQHAVLLADGDTITTADLPDMLAGAPAIDVSFRDVRARHTEAIEKPFLLDLLRRHNGNVSNAAADAKMTRKMIYRLARKFGIDLAEFRPN